MKRNSRENVAPKTGLERALPFGEALGQRLRQVREEEDWTGETVAWYAQQFGLGWERSTLTRIELGQRQVTAAELLVLTLIFQRSVADLLPTEPSALTSEASVGPDELRRVLTSRAELRSWHVPRFEGVFERAKANAGEALTRAKDRVPGASAWTLMSAAHSGWTDVATTKAARRLNATPEEVAVAAQKLWHRGLAQERDARLQDRGPSTARARQARRGHITRALLDELRPAVDALQAAAPNERDQP